MSEMEWLDIFADNLVGILDEARMTQQDLADATGIAKSTISKYIHKQQVPGIYNLIKISYAVDIDMNELTDFGDTIE